jgi:hypothetical protein
MPPDLIDRDLPVTIAHDGFEAVCQHMLSMIRCRNAGNAQNFRQQYFRPPVTLRDEEAGEQSYVIYRCGRASELPSPDLYSAKKTTVRAGRVLEVSEKAAFGAVVLAGHGSIWVEGKTPLQIEAVSMFSTRDEIGGDEFFVAAPAAGKIRVRCASLENLSVYQHFASGSNPETTRLAVPEYLAFGG